MRMTFENKIGSYSIELRQDLPRLADVQELLVEPLLISAGYAPERVRDIPPVAPHREQIRTLLAAYARLLEKENHPNCLLIGQILRDL